eukprot:2007566-Heterocapsa_arctica.AAC.1
MANQEVRTVEMDHIMENKEMGEVCLCFTSVEDFKINQSRVCKKPAKCLMCKGYTDTQQMETFYKQEQFAGMRKYIEVMRDNEEWKQADTRKILFM